MVTGGVASYWRYIKTKSVQNKQVQETKNETKKIKEVTEGYLAIAGRNLDLARSTTRANSDLNL